MKKILFRVASFAYFFSAAFIMFTSYSHAYIDPSAVTYMIQAVAAVVIAIGALLTVFRHKIASLFKKGSDKEEKKEIHIKEDVDDEE